MPASVSSDNTLKFTASIDKTQFLADVKDMTRSTGTFTKETVDGIKKENAAREQQLEAISQLKKRLGDLKGLQKIEIRAENLDFLKKEIEDVTKELDALNRASKQDINLEAPTAQVGRLQGLLQSGAGLMAGFFAVDAIREVGSAIIGTTAEFEKFEAVLTNTLGSSTLAQSALEMIQETASKTPFSVSELTESFVQLANRGVVLTQQEIIKLGDLAASSGKSFDQLAEATLDAMSGENERLKEFGITAEDSGETMIYTFKGVRTEVEKNSEAINKYLLSLGDVKGVAGSMEAISQTLGGEISNAADQVDLLMVEAGDSVKGFASVAIKAFSSFVKYLTAAIIALKELPSFLSENKEAFAALGVAVLTLNAANIKTAASTLYHTAVEKGRTIATRATVVAQAALNAVMNANPIMLVVSAVSALVGGFILWYNQSEKVRAVTQGLFSVMKELASIAVDLGKALIMPTPGNIAAAYKSMKNIGSSVSSAYEKGYQEQQAKDRAANVAREKAIQAEKLRRDKEQVDFAAKQKAMAEASAEAKAAAERRKRQEEQAKKEREEYAKSVAQRRKLIEETSSLEKEYSRKYLPKEDQELIALKEKFGKIRAEVEKFNKENPKLSIGLAQFDKAQTTAEDNLTYTQDTEKLLANLDEQKRLYSEYEEYKNTFGETKAKERYGKELDLASSYFDKLTDEYQKLNSIPENKRTDVQKNRLDEIRKLRAAELSEQEKSYKELAAKYISFEQQRTIITEKFQEERKTLLAKGNKEAADLLERSHKEQLSALNRSELEQNKVIKNVYSGLDNVARKEAKALISKAKELLKSAGLAADDYKDVMDKIKEAEKGIAERLPDNLIKTASALKEISSVIGQIDEKAGKAVGEVADLVGAIGNTGKAIATGDIFGAITGGVQSIFAAYSIIDKTAEKEAARQEQQQKNLKSTQLAIEGFNRLIEQQDKAIQRALGVDRIVAYRNQIKLVSTDIQKTIGELNKLVFKVDNGTGRKIDFDINLPNLGDIYGGTGGRGGSVGVKLETIQDVLNANRESINKLYTQIEKGLIGETSNGTIEQLRLLLSTYEDLEGQLEEYLNRLKEVVTGTSFSSIVDSIAEGFKNGKKYAADFADDFEELMRTAIIESLKMKALEKPLAAFYDQFATFAESDGGLTASEIAALKSVYDTIITNANAQFEQIKQISGITFPATDGSDSSSDTDSALMGRIKGITADQADIWIGRTYAMQISLVKLTEINQANGVVLSDFTTIAMDQLRVQQQIEFNTRNMSTSLGQTNQILAQHSNQLQTLITATNSTRDAVIANGG